MRRIYFPCLLALLLGFGHPLAAETPTPLSGLDAAARIVRDADGVPHIFATDEHDLFFLASSRMAPRSRHEPLERG